MEYITGCNQVLVTPRVKADGDLITAAWLDDQRMEVLDAPLVAFDNGTAPGADMPAPVR